MRAFQEGAFQEDAFQIKWKIVKVIFKIAGYFGQAVMSAYRGTALAKDDGGKSEIDAAN